MKVNVRTTCVTVMGLHETTCVQNNFGVAVFTRIFLEINLTIATTKLRNLP